MSNINMFPKSYNSLYKIKQYSSLLKVKKKKYNHFTGDMKFKY